MEHHALTLCWAAKGGSGTTVVTALLALAAPRRSLIVDLAGEMPTVLGLPEPDRPGVIDWLAGDGPVGQLVDLLVDVDDSTALLPRSIVATVGVGSDDRHRPRAAPARWEQLAGWLAEWCDRHGGDVWIDAGSGCPNASLAAIIPRRWLVTRSCYLALRRAIHAAVRPTGIVLVTECGRSLSADDIERSLGAPIVAQIAHDPKVASAVDAGLLVTRPPLGVRRELRRVAA